MHLEAQNKMKPYEAAKTDEMRILCGAPALKGHAAIKAADADKLATLLSEGAAEVSEQDSEGETMLHLAVKEALGPDLSNEPLIEEVDLVTNGVVRVAASAPPLAVSSGQAGLLPVLLKHAKSRGLAAAQRLHNDEGLLPLHLAAGRGNAALCEVLLGAGAPVDGRTNRRDEQHSGQWGKKNGQGEMESSARMRRSLRQCCSCRRSTMRRLSILLSAYTSSGFFMCRTRYTSPCMRSKRRRRKCRQDK